MSNSAALEAIHKEADGLVDKGTWGLETVQEDDDVVAEAKSSGKKVHIGSLMTICSEKFAELEEQFRVLKGRVVYRGDCARDEEGAAAVYQNLSASPTSIRGMNANIAYGHCTAIDFETALRKIIVQKQRAQVLRMHAIGHARGIRVPRHEVIVIRPLAKQIFTGHSRPYEVI